MHALRRHLVSATLAGFALLAAWSAADPARAQVIDSKLWGTDGGVTTMARVGNTLYIGGGFNIVGPCTGGGVPVDRATGAPCAAYPHVAGRVSAVVSDGAGGWFVGGHFDAIEGQPRANLAHVLADGSLAAWTPMLAGEEGFDEEPWATRRPPGASALVLRGTTLYVGGRFQSVDGVPRHNLAAFDVTTGAILAWDPNADDEVWCLALQGNTLYAGGEFRKVAGLDRQHIAAVDARDGRPTSWNPDAEARVRSLAIDGRTIYAAGDFQAIGGQSRNCLAALDAATGAATGWDPGLYPLRRGAWLYDGVYPFVAAIAVRGRTVYASGLFDGARGQARRWFCAFDARSGDMTPFAPQPSSWATTIVPAGNLLYVGGDWYDLAGAAVPHVAALDPTTGRATAWNPRANGMVEALGVDAATVYVGGGFTSMHDWQFRSSFAALDLATGGLAEQPRIDAHGVARLAAIGDTLYISGAFTTAGGQPRAGLAAFDARTGALTSWDPGALGMGGAIAMVHDRLVYVVGHSTRPPGFAKLDAVTAQPTAFDAGLDYDGAGEIAEANGVDYVTGDFIHVGGQFRPFVAAVDARTGALLPWNPMANPADYVINGIQHIATNGHAVYLGGYFYGTSWFPRQGAAAVDPAVGALLPWSPGPPWDDGWWCSSRVNKLALRGDEVWIGGSFGYFGGRTFTNLAVVDATSGLALPIDLRVNGAVNEIVPDGDRVFVGGQFANAGGMPRNGLFAVTLPPRAAPHAMAAATAVRADSPAFSVGPCRPNPLRSTGVVGFSLPRGARVTLAVYDLRGRRVAVLLDGQRQDAGLHEAPLATAGWRAGVYFLRLEADGLVATQRLVVVD